MRDSLFKRSLPLFLAAILGFSQTALAAPRGDADPIVIGGSLSLSGKYAEMGKMQEKGYRLWETEVNARGGLLGRPVKVLVLDDGSSAPKAAEVYEELLRGKKVPLIFSPYSSELTLAVADVVEKFRYPMLAAGASSEKIWERPRRYTFGVYSTAGRYFIGFLELCAIHKRKTVSITGFPDAFSRSTVAGARKWAERFGLSVVHFDIVEGRDEQVLEAEAGRIAAARPDVVIVAGHFNETVSLRRALEKKDLKKSVFAGSVGPAMQEFQQDLGPLAEGVFGASQWEPDERILYPGSRAFIQDFRKAYGEEPSYHAATAYSSVKMLAEAVRKTGSLDREKIRRFVVSGEHKTILGPFKLRSDGTQIGHKSIIIQWQGGKKEIVWPETMRTSPPRFPQ
ncbi:MAG: amino acid ABC transporter substrate-binding protein [Deltaproteobacteria bacterium]|nr:amino acid ABC transporter substrate-binding protein [Deltaproteobacteria bacterium]